MVGRSMQRITTSVRWALRAIIVASCAGSVLLLVGGTPAQALTFYPSLPGNIQVKQGDGSLTISWEASSAGTDIGNFGPAKIIGYKTIVTPVGQSSQAGMCDSMDVSCTVQGLQNGTAYNISVTACNTNNWRYPNGNYCATQNAGPATPCCAYPVPPGNVQAVAGDGKITVTWTLPANSPAQTGPIQKYTVTSTPELPPCETPTLSCEFRGLPNGGPSYTFFVTATNSAGTSQPAASAGASAAAPPGAPTKVQAFLVKDTAQVSWIGPESNGGSEITAYTVTSTPAGLTCTTAALSCQIKGLKVGQDYTFTVRASNATGPGPVSGASGVAKLIVGPSAPRTAAAQLSGYDAIITWKAPASTGGLPITKYTVTSSPGNRTCTTAKLTCTIAGLGSGTKYVFSVQATTAKGSSLRVTTPPVYTAKPDQAIS